MPKQTIMRTLRYEAGQARVTALHAAGNIDIIAAIDGVDDPLSNGQVVEALRNAIKAVNAIGTHIEHHIDDHRY